MYLRPRTIEDAVAALVETKGRIVAGGTDVMPAMVDQPRCTPFIDISRIEDLRGIVIAGGKIRMGARTTWTDIVRADLPPALHGLQAAAREVGSRQIQNVGTIAGNLCNASPAADGVPPLLTLDAEVELTSAAGRRSMPLASFILGNRRTELREGEMLTAVTVSALGPAARSAFLKLGARRYLVISIAMASAVLERGADGTIADARIAIGACSAVARRLSSLENDLVGKPFDPSTAALVAARHVAELTPIDDVRATAAYRTDAAETVARRILVACLSENAHA
jgi:CO/xanthine dehydrogenase FAD-binding subunit